MKDESKMKTKNIVSVILLIFVLASVIVFIAKEAGKTGEPAQTTGQKAVPPVITVKDKPARQNTTATPAGNIAADEPAGENTGARPERKITVFYFRTNVRCRSCKLIESFSYEAIQAGFAEALENKSMEWQVVNVEEAGNEHYIKEYQLYTKSVVLVESEGSKELRWKNLEKVWNLLNDKNAFISYVQEEVKKFRDNS